MFPQKNWHLDNVVSLNISNETDIQHTLNASETFYTEVWAEANPLFTGKESLPAHLRMVHAINCSNFTGEGLPAHVHTLTVEDSETFTGEELADHLSFWEKMIGKRRGLRRLRVRNCPNFSGKNLPLSLEELHVEGFTGTVLKVHRRVRIVSVDNCPHLREIEQEDRPFGFEAKGPYGIKVGGVKDAFCPSFEGSRLPPNLTRLDVYSSEKFTGQNIPASVDRLTVVECPSFKPETLQPRDHYDRLIIE